MRHVDIRNATVEWLEAHLSRFGELSRHVPRDLVTAQALYLSESLDISISEVSLSPADGYILMQTTESLSGQTLRLLIQAVILCEGRPYGFDSLSPESDDRSRDRDGMRRLISIRFHPL